MSKKTLFALLFVAIVAPVASANITGITGTMDGSVQRGQTSTFDLDVTTDSNGFSGTLNVYINAGTDGINLINCSRWPTGGCSDPPAQWTTKVTTMPSLTCTAGRTGGGTDFESCQGAVSIPANGTLHITQRISAGLLAPTTALFSPGVQSWTISIGPLLTGIQTKTGTITITDKRPDVRISTEPSAMVDARVAGQSVSAGAASTAFSLTNYGNADGLVNFSNSGSFFTTSCSGSMTVPAGKSILCTINAKAVAPQTYFGKITIVGDTTPATIVVVVQLYVDDRPTGTPKPRPAANRVDAKNTGNVSATSWVIPLASDPTVTLGIVNDGDGPVRGLFSSDVDWIILPQSAVVIAPGQTQSYDISVDLTNRPALTSDANSLTATVTLTYLLPASAKTGRIGALDSPGTGSVSVTFVSTVSGSATSATPPPIDSVDGGDTLFIPGVGHVVGSVGQFISDLVVFPSVGFSRQKDRGLFGVDMYFTPLGSPSTAAKKVSVGGVTPPGSVALADMVSTVYGNSSSVGTLQIRVPPAAEAWTGLNANVFNVSNRTGTYGTSLPVFNAFYAVKGTDKEYLTGLRKDATSHTNVYLQESQGSDITANIDFYDASGNKIGTTQQPVPAFGAVQLGGATVPTGTVSAAVGVASGGGAVHAYATPVDEASGDTWIVADWSRIFLPSFTPVDVLIPVAGAAPGANNTFFKTDAAIMNVGTTPSTGTLRYWISGGPTIDKTISLNVLQTQVLTDVTSTLFNQSGRNIGYMTYTPTSGRVAITSRNYTTVQGSAATFGTAVPTLPLHVSFPGASSNFTGVGTFKGQYVRIAGIEDSSLATVGAAAPATFRSNFGLIEVAGQPATVQITIYFNTFTSSTSVIQGGSATYTLAPNEFKLIGNIANAILGANRTNFGDIHNMTVEFTVTDGAGAVVPFISSIDNGSGDSTFRVQ